MFGGKNIAKSIIVKIANFIYVQLVKPHIKNFIKLLMDKFDKLPQRKGQPSVKTNKKVL